MAYKFITKPAQYITVPLSIKWNSLGRGATMGWTKGALQVPRLMLPPTREKIIVSVIKPAEPEVPVSFLYMIEGSGGV